MDLMPIVPIAGIVAVLFATYLAWDVLKQDTGTVEMRQIGDIIFEAATAFLRRQYQTIGILALVAAVVVGVVLALLSPPMPGVTPQQIGVQTAIAFLVGAGGLGTRRPHRHVRRG